ncbi:MAG: hypothetical protein U9R29_10040 [Thermodesulfobacteriota bacterium]|nr:hypothetical protein [Thermodesulfobacteriota bacterium]
MKLIFLNLLIICIGCGFAYAEVVPAPAPKSLLEITASDSATARRVMQQAADDVQLVTPSQEQRAEQLLPADYVNPVTVRKMNCDKTGVRSRLHRRQFECRGSKQGQGLQQGQGRGRGRH